MQVALTSSCEKIVIKIRKFCYKKERLAQRAEGKL
jgi:hypothetical protein